MKNRVVIGIDESYTRTGVTVLLNGNMFRTMSINFEKSKSNSEKRLYLKGFLNDLVHSIVKDCKVKTKDITVIVERIRTFSGGHLSTQYLITTGALVATIVDAFYKYKIPVYSVDTKAWKNAIVGTTKPKKNKYGINPNKYPTVLYVRDKGLLEYIVEEYTGRGKKGVIMVNKGNERVRCKINDDIADSYCIAMYGFLPEHKQKLKEEKF